MKARTIRLALMFLTLFCAIAIPARAQTGNAQDMLNQYVTNLQSNPSDTALREKIIALALTMDPHPRCQPRPGGINRAAWRPWRMLRGPRFQGCLQRVSAGNHTGSVLANGYRNLAIAQDKAGNVRRGADQSPPLLADQAIFHRCRLAEDLKSKVEYRKERIAKAKEKKTHLRPPRRGKAEELRRPAQED